METRWFNRMRRRLKPTHARKRIIRPDALGIRPDTQTRAISGLPTINRNLCWALGNLDQCGGVDWLRRGRALLSNYSRHLTRFWTTTERKWLPAIRGDRGRNLCILSCSTAVMIIIQQSNENLQKQNTHKIWHVTRPSSISFSSINTCCDIDCNITTRFEVWFSGSGHIINATAHGIMLAVSAGWVTLVDFAVNWIDQRNVFWSILIWVVCSSGDASHCQCEKPDDLQRVINTYGKRITLIVFLYILGSRTSMVQIELRFCSKSITPTLALTATILDIKCEHVIRNRTNCGWENIMKRLGNPWVFCMPYLSGNVELERYFENFWPEHGPICLK